MIRQLGRFAAVGVGGTVAYLAVYAVLRGLLPAQAASPLARVLVAVATTWLNSRFTFRAATRWRVLLPGALGGLLIGSGLSAVALAVFATPDRAAEITVLAVVNVLAALARFGLLRSLVARDRQAGHRPRSAAFKLRLRELTP